MKTSRRTARSATTLAVLSLLVSVLVALSGCSQSREEKLSKAVAKAEEFVTAGKPNEAVIEARSALQIDKDHVPALHVLGRAYAAKSWYADAARELRRAQDIAGKSVPIAADLGMAMAELGAWDEVEAQAERILAVEPRNPRGLYLRAAGMLGRGRAEEALKVIDEGGVAAAVPEGEALRGRGLSALGRGAEAEQAYRAALTKNPKDYASLLGLGQELLKKNAAAEAEAKFREAKAISPTDPKARLGLAAARAGQGNLPDAIRELETLDARARLPRVIIALGAYYLQAGRATEAVPLLAPIASRFPKVAQARYLLGNAYLATNRAGSAIPELEAAAKLIPESTQTKFRLAMAYGRGGRPREALAVLDGLAKVAEKEPAVHLERARALSALGRADDALQAATTAQRLAPQAPQPYLVMGQIRAVQGNRKAARELFTKAAEMDANFAPAHLALGGLAFAESDPEGGMQQLDAAVKAAPKAMATIRAKAAALVRQKKVKEAIEFVEGTVKAEPGRADLQGLLGTLYATDRQTDKATVAYKKALELAPRSVEPRFGLARLALAQGREDEAIGHLAGIVKDQPGHPTAVLLLSALYDKAGRHDQAVPMLEAAMKAGPDRTDFSLRLAEAYTRTGRYADTIKLMSAALQASPGLPGALAARGQAYLATGETAAGLKDFTELVRTHPKSAPAHLALARALAASGRTGEAQAEYRETLRLAPDFTQAKAELAAVSGERPDAATLAKQVELAQARVKQDPKNVAARVELARLLLGTGKAVEGEAQLKTALEQAPTNVGANILMAIVRTRQGQGDAAADHLRAALRANPSDVQANVLMSQYLVSRGRREEAITLLESAMRTSPNLREIQLRLGLLYLDAGRVGDADRVAKDMEREAPRTPGLGVLRGLTSLAQGKPQAAADEFSAVVKATPNVSVAHRGLAQAYQALNRNDLAIASYQRAVALDGRDVVALNNLAWLLSEVRNKPDEALPLAVKAEQLAPQAANVLDTLGWVHYRRGAYNDAERLLRRAVDKAPQNAALQYHLGLTYSKLGKRPDAVSALRRAAQLDPRLAHAEKIDDLIKQLGG